MMLGLGEETYTAVIPCLEGGPCSPAEELERQKITALVLAQPTEAERAEIASRGAVLMAASAVETAREAELCGWWGTYVAHETPPTIRPATQELADQQERATFCQMKPEIKIAAVVVAALFGLVLFGGLK